MKTIASIVFATVSVAVLVVWGLFSKVPHEPAKLTVNYYCDPSSYTCYWRLEGHEPFYPLSCDQVPPGELEKTQHFWLRDRRYIQVTVGITGTQRCFGKEMFMSDAEWEVPCPPPADVLHR